MGDRMAPSQTFLTDEIDPAKLRILGFEIGQICLGRVLTIILIAQQREIISCDREAQDVLARCRHETLAERAQDLLGLTLILATAILGITLATSWGF